MKAALVPLAVLLMATTAIAPEAMAKSAHAVHAGAHAAAQVVSADTTYSAGDYTLTWTTSRPGAAVRVYVSADPAAPRSRMKLLAPAARQGRATFRNPVGAGVRPYFLVAADGDAGVRTATRVVPLEGASNFRDLGGYRSADGRHVKWGLLFRSNALADMTAADYRTVNRLNVRLVCDLRTDSERHNQPTVWQGKAPRFITSPKAEMASSATAMFGPGAPTAESARQGLIGFYRRAPDDYAGEYRAMFARLLRGDAPMIVHCTAGKDRTGVASALLLSALGVPRPTVTADYALTADLLKAGAERRQASAGYRANMAVHAKIPPEVMQAMMGSDPAYIEAALDAAAAKYGSLDAYLEKAMGLGPAERTALQARYLE